jgi:hypothetical protein
MSVFFDVLHEFGKELFAFFNLRVIQSRESAASSCECSASCSKATRLFTDHDNG